MRYFFHIHDGHELHDEEGTEFATLEEARLEAVRTAGAFIRDHAKEF